MALLLLALVSSPANTCMIPRDTRPTLEDCEARGSAAPQAQRQSSRGLWAAPLLAEIDTELEVVHKKAKRKNVLLQTTLDNVNVVTNAATAATTETVAAATDGVSKVGDVTVSAVRDATRRASVQMPDKPPEGATASSSTDDAI